MTILWLLLKGLFLKPYDSGKRWKHSAVIDYRATRINHMMIADCETWSEGQTVTVLKDGLRHYVDGPIAYADSAHRVRGQCLILEQDIKASATVCKVLVLCTYGRLLSALMTAINSEAQRSAQAVVSEMLTDR